MRWAQQKLLTEKIFNAITFQVAMAILVHNWAGNPPVLVAQLRYIEKKNQYTVPKA